MKLEIRNVKDDIFRLAIKSKVYEILGKFLTEEEKDRLDLLIVVEPILGSNDACAVPNICKQDSELLIIIDDFYGVARTIQNLIHELIHIKQFIKREFSIHHFYPFKTKRPESVKELEKIEKKCIRFFDCYSWKGTRGQFTSYWDRPWEIEARELTEQLRS